MELIQIIYPVLMFTFGVLVLVIVFSFFSSKMNKGNSRLCYELETIDYNFDNKDNINSIAVNKNQDYYSSFTIDDYNNIRHKENSIRNESPVVNDFELEKTNVIRNNRRYTILNKGLYENNNRPTNYYL